jgi:hypothetical protein
MRMPGPNAGLTAYCLMTPRGRKDYPPCELIAGHLGRHWVPVEKRSPVTDLEGVAGYYGHVDPDWRPKPNAQEHRDSMAEQMARRYQAALHSNDPGIYASPSDGNSEGQ